MSTPPAVGQNKDRPVGIIKAENETEHDALARATVGPLLRHGVVCNTVRSKMFGELPAAVTAGDYMEALGAKARAARGGDLAIASDLLVTQALTLDAMFTELARRATVNLGEYPEAAERYARLALKAQSNSRAALDSLARLHQPREQTVRHVHVNEGAQAVIADQFHHHAGGRENGKSVEQPHAKGSRRAAVPGPDPFRDAVPVASDQGKEPLPDARGQEPGRAEG